MSASVVTSKSAKLIGPAGSANARSHRCIRASAHSPITHLELIYPG